MRYWESPEIDSPAISKLRPVQRSVFTALAGYLVDVATRESTFEERARARLVLPPRTGKTVIAAHLLSVTGLSALFVVPTRALVPQIQVELARAITNRPIGVFFGDEKRVVPGGINVTTYASLQQLDRTQTMPPGFAEVPLVILDEAHHCMTPRRQELLDRCFHPAAVCLALTATPDYDERRRLARFFPDRIYELDLTGGLALGLLAPARVWVAEVDVAASKVRLVAGDFDEGALGRLMTGGPFFAAVKHFRYSALHRDRPALICCSTRQQAFDLWQFLRRHGPAKRVPPGLLLGTTKPAERRRLLREFADGELDTLINVGVLIEGWDAPHCKLVLDLAPTTSWVRAAQKYFRALTPYQDQTAHLVTLLPTELCAAPVLPTDLLLPRGISYCSGQLIDDAGASEPKPLAEAAPRSPIQSVRLKQRIVAQAAFAPPRLDPSQPDQIRAVLDSHRDFDPSVPSTRYKFGSLLFSHGLWSGRGALLLKFLQIPAGPDAYHLWLAALYPESAIDWQATQLTGIPPSTFVADDLARLDAAVRAKVKLSRENRDSMASLLRALSGPPGEQPSPESVLIRREERQTIIASLDELTPRRQRVITQRYGLDGKQPMILSAIGIEQNVSGNRVRQIEAMAGRQLRVILPIRLGCVEQLEINVKGYRRLAAPQTERVKFQIWKFWSALLGAALQRDPRVRLAYYDDLDLSSQWCADCQVTIAVLLDVPQPELPDALVELGLRLSDCHPGQVELVELRQLDRPGCAEIALAARQVFIREHGLACNLERWAAHKRRWGYSYDAPDLGE